MKIPIKIMSVLFKVDLISLYFTNLFLDIFDPVGGSGLALVFSLTFKI